MVVKWQSTAARTLPHSGNGGTESECWHRSPDDQNGVNLLLRFTVFQNSDSHKTNAGKKIKDFCSRSCIRVVTEEQCLACSQKVGQGEVFRLLMEYIMISELSCCKIKSHVAYDDRGLSIFPSFLVFSPIPPLFSEDDLYHSLFDYHCCSVYYMEINDLSQYSWSTPTI